MRTVHFLPLLFLLLFSPLSFSQALTPKYEVRAVWLTTASGLDWPHTTDQNLQREALNTIIDGLASAHLNTIFFQARARGDAYYHSNYEPWAENLTGRLGKDPGWDPLAYILNRAHQAGMEVHAWFNVFKVRGSSLPLTSLQHPSRASSRWVVQYGGEAWIDPGIPDARTYLINVLLDLVKNYDIDGVNFDYLRYPGRDFPDDESFRRFGKGMNRDEWRRSNIDKFVAEAYDKVTALKPMLKVGSSPLGTVAHAYDFRNPSRFWYQDAPEWLMKGKMDYVSPQIYWNIGETNGDPDFAEIASEWQEYSAGRHVVAGIAAYKRDVAREIGREIDTSRAAGTKGQSFFRYEHIADFAVLDNRYKTTALIPPMSWKDSVPPLSPRMLAASEVRTNVYQLEWLPSLRASDGDSATHYVIYRSTVPQINTNDPRLLVHIVPSNLTSFVDTITVSSGVSNYYAVTALDKGNNESTPSNTAGGMLKEVIAMKNTVRAATSLSASISHSGQLPALVAYKLISKTDIRLDVLQKNGDGPDQLLATLVQGEQSKGTYIIGLKNVQLGPGRYVIRLNAGGAILEQPLAIDAPR